MTQLCRAASPCCQACSMPSLDGDTPRSMAATLPHLMQLFAAASSSNGASTAVDALAGRGLGVSRGEVAARLPDGGGSATSAGGGGPSTPELAPPPVRGGPSGRVDAAGAHQPPSWSAVDDPEPQGGGVQRAGANGGDGRGVTEAKEGLRVLDVPLSPADRVALVAAAPQALATASNSANATPVGCVSGTGHSASSEVSSVRLRVQPCGGVLPATSAGPGAPQQPASATMATASSVAPGAAAGPAAQASSAAPFAAQAQPSLAGRLSFHRRQRSPSITALDGPQLLGPDSALRALAACACCAGQTRVVVIDCAELLVAACGRIGTCDRWVCVMMDAPSAAGVTCFTLVCATVRMCE
jgi:hypothetical protein